jgi:hypothetical protein
MNMTLLPDRIVAAIEALKQQRKIVEDVIAELLTDRYAATQRADGLAADLAACVGSRDKALADAEAADAAQIAHQKKWESVCKASRENGTCACSYDSADDVCDFHAPKLAAVKADLAAAQAKLAEVEKERAYYKLVSEGWSEDEARGEVWPAADEQGGAP